MTTVLVLVIVFAAVALGLGAFAVWIAVGARSKAIDAEARVARHQQEHRSGLEGTGLRRHRQGEPALTGQIPRVPGRPPRREPEGVDLEELPATAEQAAPTGRFLSPPPALPARPDLPPPGRIDR